MCFIWAVEKPPYRPFHPLRSANSRLAHRNGRPSGRRSLARRCKELLFRKAVFPPFLPPDGLRRHPVQNAREILGDIEVFRLSAGNDGLRERLERLPEAQRLQISNSLSQMRQYCEMPLMILKAEELVGGEAAMDQILHALFNRELDPMYPYLTYEEFLDACGLTEEALDLA